MGYWHARAAQYLGAELVAVVDPDPKRATALARKFGLVATAADASEHSAEGSHRRRAHLFARLFSRFSHMRAIECGINALVEKPLVESLEKTRRLVEDAGR